jgi:hypothetical protein
VLRTITRTRRITARRRSLGILRMRHGGSPGADDQMLNGKHGLDAAERVGGVGRGNEQHRTRNYLINS